MKIGKWWKHLWEKQEASSSLVARPLLRSDILRDPQTGLEVGTAIPDLKEGQRGLGQDASVSRLNQPKLLKEADIIKPRPNLYWCNFRKANGEFDSVVIAWGTSPGNAANNVINSEIVDCFNASVVLIPVEKEWRFEPHLNVKLSAEDVRSVFPDIPMVEKRIDIQA